MKNKTAVEWLEEIFLDNEGILTSNQLIQAKAFEKKHIIEAYDAGTFYLEGELYYKETFEDESGI